MAIRSSTKQRHKPLVLERSNLVHGPLFSLGKSSSFTGDFPLINWPLAIKHGNFWNCPIIAVFSWDIYPYLPGFCWRVIPYHCGRGGKKTQFGKVSFRYSSQWWKPHPAAQSTWYKWPKTMTCLVFRFSSVIFLTFPGDFLDTNPSTQTSPLKCTTHSFPSTQSILPIDFPMKRSTVDRFNHPNIDQKSMYNPWRLGRFCG